MLPATTITLLFVNHTLTFDNIVITTVAVDTATSLIIELLLLLLLLLLITTTKMDYKKQYS